MSIMTRVSLTRLMTAMYIIIRYYITFIKSTHISLFLNQPKLISIKIHTLFILHNRYVKTNKRQANLLKWQISLYRNRGYTKMLQEKVNSLESTRLSITKYYKYLEVFVCKKVCKS